MSCFVATDEGWAWDVWVFDVNLEVWPEDLETTCRELLMAVCRHGPALAWMMFDGMFNNVEDIFRDEWAPHVYATQQDCETPYVHLAIADEVRRSASWASLVAEHRARVLSQFPELRGKS